jgi:hypothetical protein
MKNLAYIYQHNGIDNGHSIFDKRLTAALVKVYGDKFYAIEYNRQTNSLIGDVTKQAIDNDSTIIVLSHCNTFKIASWFKKSKVIFINHDLPYYAYFLQKNLPGLAKALYAWFYIHYYWRLASFIFFISVSEKGKSGIAAKKCAHIRVGVKPGGNILNFKAIQPVAVFTGNYRWSLKSKALQKAFTKPYTGTLQLAAINVDDIFRKTVTATNANVVYWDEMQNPAGIKLGVITDDFLSGFKLKALELIHSGCCLVSFSDITAEFEGIIHAPLFIRTIKSLNELDAVYNELLADANILNKFNLFYNDVCDKFNWDKTAIAISNMLANF